MSIYVIAGLVGLVIVSAIYLLRYGRKAGKNALMVLEQRRLLKKIQSAREIEDDINEQINADLAGAVDRDDLKQFWMSKRDGNASSNEGVSPAGTARNRLARRRRQAESDGE